MWDMMSIIASHVTGSRNVLLENYDLMVKVKNRIFVPTKELLPES
jgi:hypothetical protein